MNHCFLPYETIKDAINPLASPPPKDLKLHGIGDAMEEFEVPGISNHSNHSALGPNGVRWI